MYRKINRVLASLLILIVTFGMLPSNVFALEVVIKEGAMYKLPDIDLSVTTYDELVSAINQANSSGGAVINLEGDITVTAAFPEISSEVVIRQGYTIKRGSTFTGNFFTVNAGATLTFDDGVTLDGGNNWIFHKDTFMTDIHTRTNMGNYATSESGAPTATAPLIDVFGVLNLNNSTIKNSYSTATAIVVKNNGVANLNSGSLITHIYRNNNAAVFKIEADGILNMYDGAVIKENLGIHSGNNGMIMVISGQMFMHGGEICENYGNLAGIIMLHDDGERTEIPYPSFVMNGGSICHNALLSGNWGCLIYVHRDRAGSTATINGGVIENNVGCHSTGIHANGPNAHIIINGGKIRLEEGVGPSGRRDMPLCAVGGLEIGKDAVDIEGTTCRIIRVNSNDPPIVNNGRLKFNLFRFDNDGAKYGKYSVSGDGIWDGEIFKFETNTDISISSGTFNAETFQFHSGSNVTIEDGTFNGDIDVADGANLLIKKGVFSDLEAIKYLDDGLGLLKNSDGTYTVTDQVAEVNGTVYDSVASAQEAVNHNGGTIKLLAIAPIKTSVAVENISVLDLNGNDIYATVENVIPMFDVLADFTVEGDGIVDAAEFGSGFPFHIGSDDISCELTIENGMYYSRKTIVSVTNGLLTVNDGYFEAKPDDDIFYNTLDCDDTNYASNDARIELKGGTYKGFDPAFCSAEGTGTDFCAIGYKSLDNQNDTWRVVPKIPVYVCRNVQTGVQYESVSLGMSEAKTNETIELITSTSDGEIILLPGTSLDINGFTLTVSNIAGVDTTRVYDSTNTKQNNYTPTGLLKVKGSMVLSKTNEDAVPVFVPEKDGYIFVDFLFNSMNEQGDDISRINALVTSRSFEVIEYLKNGGKNCRIQIGIRLNVNGENTTRDFIFSEDTIKNVMRSNKGKFNVFERMFYANFTGVEEFESITAQVILISDTQVTDKGSELILKK